MAWRKTRLFKCDICGIEKEESGYEDHTGRVWNLPKEWRGSLRKHGICYCKKCASAIKKLGDTDLSQKAQKVYEDIRHKLEIGDTND